MKKIGFCLVLAVLCYTIPQYSYAQRACGEGYLFNKLNAEDPATMQRLREQHDQMIADALSASQNKNAKAAATSPIPVVFHFVLKTVQYNQIGGDTGIKRRVNSQLAALNKDYGGTNPDQSKIPSPFKSLFGNVG